MNDTAGGPIVGVDFEGNAALVESRRPSHNFLDIPMIQGIADAF